MTLSENFNVNDFDLLKVGDETKKWCPNILAISVICG